MNAIIDTVLAAISLAFMALLILIPIGLLVTCIQDSGLEVASAEILSLDNHGIPLEVCLNSDIEADYIAHVIVETKTDLVVETHKFYLSKEPLGSVPCVVWNLGIFVNPRSDKELWERIKTEVIAGNIKRIFVEFSRHKNGFLTLTVG